LNGNVWHDAAELQNQHWSVTPPLPHIRTWPNESKKQFLERLLGIRSTQGYRVRLEDEDLRCRVSQIWSHWITSRTDKTTSSPNSYAKKIILRLPNATYNLSSYRIMSSSHIVPQTQAVLIAICFTPSINNNAEQVRLRRVVTRTRPIRLQVDGSLHSLAL
jgi:hypothetical protein